MVLHSLSGGTTVLKMCSVLSSCSQSTARSCLPFLLFGLAPSSSSLFTKSAIPKNEARCKTVFPEPHILPINSSKSFFDSNSSVILLMNSNSSSAISSSPSIHAICIAFKFFVLGKQSIPRVQVSNVLYEHVFIRLKSY